MGLRLLTTSSTKCYRLCPRKYKLRYVDGVRPNGDAHALHFGSLWHGMQEQWWAHGLRAAHQWLSEQPEVDPYDYVKLRELMTGYDARWSDESLKAVAIEQEFRLPLVNPDTGHPSRTFQLAGKKDLVAEDDRGVWLVEHKTSSEDISAGSDYWMKLRMDTQVSNYYRGARANGHDIVGCIYDVVGKPGMKPGKATPEDKRKYKKDGTLYASQREADEAPEDYATRLREHIAGNPDNYYQRGDVPRLEADEVEAARDNWHTARAIRDAESLASWPRNPDACFNWHRACEYWAICIGEATADDDVRYRVERPHEELQQEQANNDNGGQHGSDSDRTGTHGTHPDF